MSSILRTKIDEPSGPAEPWPSLFGFREIPAWAASLVVHLLLLVIFWQIRLSAIINEKPVISTVLERELNPEDFQFETTLIDRVGAEVNADRAGPSLEAASAAVNAPLPEPKIEQPAEGQLLSVDAPATTVVLPENDTGLVERFDALGSTEYPGGVAGAVDRLTHEIATSLKERATLVVWLLDASLSLKERREAIADRIENVYRELGVLNVGQEGALLTGVVSYGESINWLTPKPIDDVGKISKAVRSVENDTSGVENVFTAVAEISQKWRSFRTRARNKRNVMIVVVTDERGDDAQNMDAVIGELRRYGFRVYCMGNAAVFGRREGYVRWVYEDGFAEYLPVDQGPESAAPERLKLAFWGPSDRGLDQIAAGFGPYALTRLCAETGGMYFVAADAGSFQFDPLMMRVYQPEYLPVSQYEQAVRSNKAKAALVRAALTTHADTVPRPRLSFRADDENILRQQLSEAQKPLAVLDHRLTEMQSILAAGAEGRSTVAEPRWRAAYDLAVGRVLAMRTRALGYNLVLADLKRSPLTFQNKKNNTWILVPTREDVENPRIKALSDEARPLLMRVIDEHPGTPWQILAERELSVPLGWTWKEGYRRYRDLNQGRPAPPRLPQMPPPQRTRPLL